MGSANVQVVWFKRDLRIRDHEPLTRAAANGPVLPLYIVEPELWKQPDAAAQHWEYIATSLRELRDSLDKLGSPLLVRTGEATNVFSRMLTALPGQIDHLWAYEETGNDWTYQRDKRVLAWARNAGVGVTEIPRDFVVRRLGSRDDWSTIAKARMHQPILPPPSQLRPAMNSNGTVFELGLIPSADELNLQQQPGSGSHAAGERAARATLQSFLDTRCIGYEKRLSSPITAQDGCSRMSAHLTYGTISLKEVLARTNRTLGTPAPGPSKKFSLKAFSERLHWRSHFIQKLEDQPNLELRSYIAAFDRLRLNPATSELGGKRFAAWTTGNTGYPMIDACMRSLNETGWINFRMRAMLVSFASYDLWIDWRATAHFLARAFIDYEPGIHYPQIQMQSGTTGINTIRIYDPIKQGLDHDPNGDFVRRWIPELRAVTDGSVHQPWLLNDTFWGAPADYPAPIVNHADAVAYAWAQIDTIKKAAQRSGVAAAINEQHGTRRPPPAARKAPAKATRR
jgi:deoxyribodipyrimidine photo-lyase